MGMIQSFAPVTMQGTIIKAFLFNFSITVYCKLFKVEKFCGCRDKL